MKLRNGKLIGDSQVYTLLEFYQALHYDDNLASKLIEMKKFGVDYIMNFDTIPKTPLMIASINSNDSLLCYLLDKGADVHFKNDKNESALSYAVYNNNRKIVEILLEYKPRVDYQSLFSYAICHNYIDIVKIFLENDLITELSEFLETAIEKGSLGCADILIERGAKLSVDFVCSLDLERINTYFETLMKALKNGLEFSEVIMIEVPDKDREIKNSIRNLKDNVQHFQILNLINEKDTPVSNFSHQMYLKMYEIFRDVSHTIKDLDYALFMIEQCHYILATLLKWNPHPIIKPNYF